MEIRKVVAAYFTNNAAGDLLARLSVNSTDDKVMDPACGSGTLFVSAYKRKLELSKGQLTSDVHHRFVERDLTGIDIMPFSAHLAAVNLALLGLPYNTDNIRIAIADSTKHRPKDAINPAREVLKEAFKSRRITDYFTGIQEIPNSKTQAGAITIQETKASPITLENVDVVIMNPPFTSSDNLPSDYKKELKRRFSSPAMHAKCLTGKLSFQAYFLLLADRFLKKDGRIACVLPFSTFVGKAFRRLDEFLVKNYTIDCIVYGLGRSAFSDNTNFSEILFVARKGKPEDSHRLMIVGVKTPPTEWTEKDVASIQEQIEASRKSDKLRETSLVMARSSKQTELINKKTGLTQLTLAFDTHFSETLSFLHEFCSRSDRVRPFHKVAAAGGFEIFAYELRIKGGGYYGFSALSVSASEKRMKKNTDVLVYLDESEKAVIARNRFTNETISIPRKALCGQVRRLSDIDHMDVSGDKEFVICKYYEGLPNVLQKIYSMEQAKEFEQRIKRDWEKKTRHGSTNFAFARRIDLGAPGTRLLSLFSDKPRFLSANSWGIRDIQSDDAKILCLWFNSTLFLMDILSKRTPTRGSWGQIDEQYILDMNCVDPMKIDWEERKVLLNLFEEIGTTRFPSLIEQLKDKFVSKRKIDATFLEILGVKGETQKTYLEKLYATTYDRIRSMKETMRGD